ncbi:hypothetical protein [Lactobacillus xujianguonis]|uniref:hypothetical protein n=1 Tax=Lactobacillus xujianguonis TaxID=2495899 RepID=UPI000FD8CCB1|nr:hypothetical protein [Lactobacillus xujianguonis]RVU72081.1 hypothetical protein EJK20_10910 [Lactobacillus xujianguonis]
MKKQQIIVGILAVTLMGGSIVALRRKSERVRIEKQQRAKAQKRRQERKLRQNLLRFLLKNYTFGEPVKSLEIGKLESLNVEWNTQYSIDVSINHNLKKAMSFDFYDFDKKFKTQDGVSFTDDLRLEERRKPLSDAQVDKMLRHIKITDEN